MKSTVVRLNLMLAVLIWAGICRMESSIAQPIISAPDGTGTIVTPNGNQFNIGGGTQSGANLYQSFQQFGLDSNQIANFLSRPDIQNILGRVVGGDASVINGLIQVTGGNSNLYLLNPSGIIFGANASLNVPASFTATTANGIQIGNNWFNATGTNDYSTLNGTPTGFAFTQSGTIFNAGNLTVGQGQSLTLIGGTVVNTGTIAAPGGTITIAAIPGEKYVRLTPQGSLLSIDLPVDTKAQLNPNSGLSPLDLPALLTGNNLIGATSVIVDNGIVKLTSSGAVIPTDAGTAIVSGKISVVPTPSLPYSITPQITILGDKVGLLSATVDASGTNGGGTILIGGDFQGQGTVPNAQFTYVDAGTTIAADALSTGDGGKVILWADQATRFLGTISARGGALGGNGGLVETSGKVYLQALGNVDSSAVNGSAGTWLLDPNDITIQTAGPDTNVTASPNFTTTDDNAIVTTGSIEAALNAGTSVTVTTASAGINSQTGDITVINNISKTAGGDATLTLNAQNSIFVNPGVQITSTASRLNVVLQGDSDSNGDGAVVLNNGSGISSNGGNITLTGQGNAINNIEGLILNNTTLNAGVGNIALTGTGEAGTTGATGIYLLGGSSLQTTTGNITFNGTGGAGTDNNYGIYLDSSSINTANGAISLTGIGGTGTGSVNYGIYLLDTAIASTSNGTITLNGTGGVGIDFNYGVNLEGTGSSISTVDGAISIIGNSAGTGNDNYGINQSNGAVITSTGSGSITLNGTGGAGTNFNYGVFLSDPDFIGTRISTVDGAISITGTGAGSGTNNHGIFQLNAATVTSTGSGTITLNGTGGEGSDGNFGVYVTGTGTSISTVDGAISITGTGAGAQFENYGIFQQSAATVTSTGSGTIALNGTGGSGTYSNFGVYLTDTGTSISTVDGAISITGTGGAGSGFTNHGIFQSNGATVASTGSGTIALNGTAGAGTNDNYGVILANTGTSISAVNGAISITGTGAGSVANNYGIVQQSAATVTSTGTAPIMLQGIGASIDEGIFTVGAGNVIGGATANGDITLTADRMTLDFVTIQGNQNLLIQPLTPNTSIGIGMGSTGTLNLNDVELANLADGFNSITIGSLTSSGTITVQSALTFNDPIKLQTPGAGGTIVANPGGTIASLGNPIDLLAAQNISTQAITTGGGNLSIVSLAGSITTNGQALDTSSPGTAGSITLTALNDITTFDLVSAGSSVEATGGDVTLISSQGLVISNNITTRGNLGGGDVLITAANTITTGAIDTSSTSGNGGNVTLDPPGLVSVLFINAQGGSNSVGGDVNINTAPTLLNPGLFQATGSFVDQSGITASISTAGGTGGDITIRHGGNGTIPFVVGNATTNGTAAAITTGAGNTIAPTQSFAETYTQGNITLTTAAPIPVQPSIPVPDAPVPDAPVPDATLVDETVFTTADEDTSLEEASTDGFLAAFSGETTDLEVGELEADFTEDYGNYFGLLAETPVTAAQTQGTLNAIESATGVKSALIYVSFVPAATAPTAALPKLALPKSLPASPPSPSEVLWQSDSQGFAFSPTSELRTLSQRSQTQRDSDILQVIVMTGKEKRILKQIPETTRGQVIELAQRLRQEITNVNSNEYLVPSQNLYQLLIAPIEPELQSRKIDNLILIPDAGLRSLPLAVLHDGQRFLVEKYSFGMMPSFSLTDTRYKSIKTASVLAMGASKFTEQLPLAAVPVELAAIVKTRPGETFLNEAFTLENLKLQRQKQSFDILHLATHGEFKSGEPANSYIQLWDSKLTMDRIQELQLSNPPIDLLVLSACRTAVGDDQAELGFAGFAIQAGVKSVLASLWYVSDSGTLGLMTEFYQQLQTAPTKSEALRRAQLAMIKGQVRLERGELRGSRGGTALPPELVALGDTSLNHPYYWAAFTMIGNPW